MGLMGLIGIQTSKHLHGYHSLFERVRRGNGLPCGGPNGIIGGCPTGTDGDRETGRDDDDTPPGTSKLGVGYPRFISNTKTKENKNYFFILFILRNDAVPCIFSIELTQYSNLSTSDRHSFKTLKNGATLNAF